MPSVKLTASGNTGMTGMSVSSSYPMIRAYEDSTDTSDYARCSISTSTTGYVYLTYDVSAIPANATITGITANARLRISSTTRVANRVCQLYSGTTAKGTNVDFSSTANGGAVVSPTAGDWTRSELSDLRMKIGGTGSSSSQSKYIYIYGTDITVTYTEASVAVTGVSVSPTTALISVNDTVTLTETVSPSNATDKSVSWSSDDTSVATVSNGVVTGVSPGTARIAVTTTDGGYTVHCVVTVINGTATWETLYNNSVTVQSGSYNYFTVDPYTTPFQSGEVYRITFDGNSFILPTTAYSGAYDGYGDGYASLNPCFLYRSSAQILVGATALSTGSKSLKIERLVSGSVSVTGVSVSPTTASVAVGATTTLTATVSPSNATDKSVSWSSSNTSVATVSGGVVTGAAAGSATITVTTTDGGYTATCAVTVTGGGATWTTVFEDTIGVYSQPEVNQYIWVSPYTTPFEAGQTYRVTWGSDTYICQTQVYTDSASQDGYAIGDATLLTVEGGSGEEPFFIFRTTYASDTLLGITSTPAGNVNIKIELMTGGSTAPVITVGTPSRSIISDETGYDQCVCTFSADQDLQAWEARATKSGTTPARGVGLLVESGTTLTAGVNATIYVDDEELTDGDGEYTITVYGQSVGGVWSE